jgi:hypothetical protein
MQPTEIQFITMSYVKSFMGFITFTAYKSVSIIIIHILLLFILLLASLLFALLFIHRNVGMLGI